MSNGEDNEVTNYIVTGVAPDYNEELTTMIYDADESILETLLKAFQRLCSLSRGETATLLEEGVYDFTVTKIVAGKPVIVDIAEVKFPWLERQRLDNQITELQKGLATFRSLMSLNDIPGAPTIFQAGQMDVTATEDFIKKLQQKRDSMMNNWSAIKSDVNARPLRQVQVDPPENAPNVPF